MNSPTTESTDRYRCPGQTYAISRAVHLGRLAGFFPACRQCPHRDDTEGLSPRQIRQLRQTRHRGVEVPLFGGEGAGGVIHNDLSADDVRRIAAAFGVSLRHALPDGSTRPLAILAGDGRPIAAELVVAAGEGLRWAGCQVADLGAASAPCVAMAVERLSADGGLLVGNPSGKAAVAGLTFWTQHARPLSSGDGLDDVAERFQQGTDRPTREYGPLRRVSFQADYLAGLSDYFHALRPLQIVTHCTCPPVWTCLETLTEQVACRFVHCHGGPEEIGRQVVDEGAHLGLILDDDGQRCTLLDERGRTVPTRQLLLLVAADLLKRHPDSALAVEGDVSPKLQSRILAMGGRLIAAGATRADMHRTLCDGNAILGADRRGRLWYRHHARLWFPDALTTVALLLTALSRSDRPLSTVLDADAPLA